MNAEEFLTNIQKIKSDFAGRVQTREFPRQVRLVLRNVEIIDPTSIEQYVARDGYFGLHKAVCEMTPDQIITTILDGGLRGRGGAGFSTGRKWGLVKSAAGNEKFVICDANGGDPNAQIDRLILENDPHCVLEAMIIAGFAVGAAVGIVYVPPEYAKAVKTLEYAIARARELGVLGQNIFGGSFNFDVQIKFGTGAFVCGEETALIASIEGRRAEPVQRPPFPTNSGLYRKPTLINSTETFAVIPMTILRGAEYLNKIGTETARGTKVFALSGDVKNAGFVEVPLGTDLNTLIFEIGGGTRSGRAVRAAQIGGPCGGCVPLAKFDLPLDYGSVQKFGAILGSGGIEVLDESVSMVDAARDFIKFSVAESCGKCSPCRIGNRKLLGILEKFSAGVAVESDLDELENLGAVVAQTSLCKLGQNSPNAVLSSVKYFRDEYLARIRRSK